MIDIFTRIGAAFVCAVIFCVMTVKMLGAMQQSGYKNKTFLHWLRRGDNLFFNRLFVLSLSLAVFSATTSLAFSFLEKKWALLISAIPFFLFLVVFILVDYKYALKLPYKITGRFSRLFVIYLLVVFGVNLGVLTLLSYLSGLNGSTLYGLIAYAPFSLMPMLLPYLLCLTNLVCAPFETLRNHGYVNRAQKILNQTQVIRVGIVGSFGKTSVKNILKELLSVKYKVLETPASYNTPMGIARTVAKEDFPEKEVFIAEMGAKKAGDIAELCALVKPDYAIFTGICEQHISSFQSLENVFAEKSRILESGAVTVCGESLQERITSAFGENVENVLFADYSNVSNLEMTATGTKFVLTLDGENISVNTKLLGRAAVENILLAATLAKRMGLTGEEIERGLLGVGQIPHRLQLLENNGVYILDDGYNCNPRGAVEALAALCRFQGRKCIVTPGIVECGVLEEKLNGDLGARIAACRLDYTILVGETLVGSVKKGYLDNGGDESALVVAKSLDEAKERLAEWICNGDAVLFLNDLPDVY
ncbi:MAG: hypothetical protein IJ329_02215 [Clostridia bacterium]|nr:hypothetical protein [Clostridia bacterium]